MSDKHELFGPSTLWEEDIHVMHTYKDAILTTEGSYILYPGDEECLFRESVRL